MNVNILLLEGTAVLFDRGDLLVAGLVGQDLGEVPGHCAEGMEPILLRCREALNALQDDWSGGVVADSEVLGNHCESTIWRIEIEISASPCAGLSQDGSESAAWGAEIEVGYPSTGDQRTISDREPLVLGA